MGLQNYAAAEEVLKEAISLAPDFMQARLNLARCYYESDRWRESTEELEKVVEIDPDHGVAHMNLAILYRFFLLDKEQAKIHSHRAIELGLAEEMADHAARAIKDYERRHPEPQKGMPRMPQLPGQNLGSPLP